VSPTLLRRAALVTCIALIVTACGSNASAEGLSIEDPRARSTAPTAERGAVYFDLVNSSDEDRSVVSASVGGDVAGVVELHETIAAEGHGDGDMDDGEGGMDSMDGMAAMQMREVAQIDAVAGETVALEPGGLHVMLFELAGPLEAGATFELTLAFDDGSEETVNVEVRDEV